MKRLVLLRHAKSSWAEPDMDDHERPLNQRGRKGAQVIAGYLRQRRIRPDLVLCSTARRAQETLEIVKEGLGAGARIENDQALYLAGAEGVLARVKRVDGAGVGTLMVVGHNPDLQNLALMLAEAGQAALTSRIRAKFPTAGLVVLDCPADAWDELMAGTCRIADFTAPGDLT